MEAGQHVLEDDVAGHRGDLGVEGQVGFGEALLVGGAHAVEQLLQAATSSSPRRSAARPQAMISRSARVSSRSLALPSPNRR
jgi:hypothetical protein